MADIFLSYSHDDRIKTLRLIRALEAQGLTVWWDQNSIPGTQWNNNIASELTSARCVIVVWSETSCNSGFVKEEAGLALAHNTYVPITFDQTAPPSQFSSIEVLDLSRWLGATNDPNFVLLLTAIERLRGDKCGETEGLSRKVNKNRSRLRVWGLTIGGTFYGFASGVIAKPLTALGSALVIAAIGFGAHRIIPQVWTGSHNNPARISVLHPPPKPSISASDVIGRWGLGAYHRDEDRARTEAITKDQCKIPYVISAGNGGTVMMLTHDSPNIVEVQIKANQDGKTFIGPGAEPGGPDDREVVSYDGRVLILKWVDPEVAGRYGTQILVRCA
jgi:hypothetical protein